MRLGIFGGTFDPIHLGHLILAETVREACRLDQVLFLPARISPLKQQTAPTEARHRLEMVRLAIAGHPAFQVDDLELRRSGPSYTVDTLRHLHAQRPDDELFLMIGADSLADLSRWREPRELLDLAQLVVVNRGDTLPDLTAFEREFQRTTAGVVDVVNMPPVDISATELRARAATGRSIRYRTPRAVEMYILEHRLYRSDPVSMAAPAPE